MAWRETITLLKAHGHPDASRYSMGRVFVESWLVRRYQRKQMAGAAAAFSLTVNAMFDKKGGEAQKAYKKFVSEA